MYTAEISKANPTLVLVLIDQSAVMAVPFGGSKTSIQADEAALFVNRLLYTLVLRCVHGTSVLDRFHIGVFGYGGRIRSVLGGALQGRDVVPISEIARSPLRVENRTEKVDQGGLMVEKSVRSPVWVEKQAEGPTPLKKALKDAAALVAGWIAEHPDSFPPLVFNYSGGECGDGDPAEAAQTLHNLSTHDGNVLLFNVFLSRQKTPPVEFPSNDTSLTDANAKRLFRLSSLVPPPLFSGATRAGLTIDTDARCFATNMDLALVLRLLDIGTRVDFALPKTQPDKGPAKADPPKPPSRSTVPERKGPAAKIAVDVGRFYDVRCSLGGKLVTYAGVRFVGFSGPVALQGEPLFDRWLVMEYPSGRRVFLDKQAVVSIEDPEQPHT